MDSKTMTSNPTPSIAKECTDCKFGKNQGYGKCYKHNPPDKQLSDLVFEICDSLYRTGFNDGKHNIQYYPNPAQFKVDQLLSIFSEEYKKNLQEVYNELINDRVLDKETIRYFYRKLSERSK